MGESRSEGRFKNISPSGLPWLLEALMATTKSPVTDWVHESGGAPQLGGGDEKAVRGTVGAGVHGDGGIFRLDGNVDCRPGRSVKAEQEGRERDCDGVEGRYKVVYKTGK